MKRRLRKVRLLVADDHETIRRGVRALIERQPGWEICGEAATGRESVKKALDLAPDVVILDIAMPELNGLEAARQILKANPQAEVLILTMHESEQLVKEVLAAGAHGYVLKSDAGGDLVAAVRALSNHKVFFTSTVAKTMLEEFRRAASMHSEAEPVSPHLTPREREILQLLAEGRTNRQIADILSLSIKTVETHRANIFTKLGFHSIGDLIRHAVRNKIVSI
jgi:DNA-binding NarL/FixJ family response regulator